MKSAHILLTLTAIVLMALPGMAQETKKQGRRTRLNPLTQLMLQMHQLHEAIEALDLSTEQQDQLKQVREELGTKMMAEFEKVQDILSEEQKTVAKDTMEQGRADGKEGRELFQAVEKAVRMTDEQGEKMAQIAKSMKPLQQQLRRKVMATLTAEQKAEVQAKVSARAKKKTAGKRQAEGKKKTSRKKRAS
jgi:hypothetical protein